MSELYRLTPEVYEKLEAGLPKPIVTGQTTEHQVGYMLGIQYVLSVLREGFTIGDSEARQPSPQATPRSLRRGG